MVVLCRIKYREVDAWESYIKSSRVEQSIARVESNRVK